MNGMLRRKVFVMQSSTCILYILTSNLLCFRCSVTKNKQRNEGMSSVKLNLSGICIMLAQLNSCTLCNNLMVLLKMYNKKKLIDSCCAERAVTRSILILTKLKRPVFVQNFARQLFWNNDFL